MRFFRMFSAVLVILGLSDDPGICEPATRDRAPHALSSTMGEVERAASVMDRKAILAMAGNYHVTFDFRETVPLHEGYKLKDDKVSHGNEIVQVIEDRGDFISLQHTLLVGKERDIVVKHWRQDWVYEPEAIWEFVGHNSWKNRKLSPSQREGKWAQFVYQVDDTPRYAAAGEWVHENGVSAWTSPPTWRPLPRRDATKRNDYDVIVAVNRHTLTPDGWVHEQDNSKLVLADEPYYLVREVGLNTYSHSDTCDTSPVENYWAATGDFWAAIRAEWTRVAEKNKVFGLTVEGEPTEVYMPILGIAADVAAGDQSIDQAVKEALEILHSFLKTEPHIATKK